MYDVIIIGAGPAGISASLYTQRANLNTLVLYKKDNTSLIKTSKIENYYGFEKGIDGRKIYENGIKQAQNIGVKLLEEEVIKISKENNFKIETLNNSFESKAVIIATGISKNKPKIEGIDKFEGKGISYCAICDGFFYRNKNVAVIGNGDFAISEIMDLKNIVNKATILTNGKEIPNYRAENVDTISKEIKSIEGKNKVEKIVFKDNTDIKVDGVFIAQGLAGSMEFAIKTGAKLKNNNIVVNEKMETSIEGLYACGDCTGGLYQISKAVYEGTKAGLEAIKFIKNRKDE